MPFQSLVRCRKGKGTMKFVSSCTDMDELAYILTVEQLGGLKEAAIQIPELESAVTKS